MITFAGCDGRNSTPIAYETLHLSWKTGIKVNQITFDEDEVIIPVPPNDAVQVRSVAKEIVLPKFNSPSLIGERAIVKLEVHPGTIPNKPNCSSINLAFDSYVVPFSVGDSYTFIFLPDGTFWGILELPFN